MSQKGNEGRTIKFHYRFAFPNGVTKEFDIKLDYQTLQIVASEKEDYPEWTKLEYEQCENCPLSKELHSHCPVAKNLSDVISFFKDVISYEEADIEITTENRTYKKHTAVQYGLSSMIGIFMVTSGCPTMDKLRPLVATHIPFASLEESTYRAISMYLLAQYFRMKNGMEPDWELKNLVQTYTDVQTLNKHFNKRISKIHTQDAGLNAVFHLNCHAQFTNLFLLEEELDDIKRLFHGFLQNSEDQKTA